MSIIVMGTNVHLMDICNISNDFWICTRCVIGVPSLLMPCGRCHSNISFIPLTMPEFEDFVRKQRQMKREREEEIKLEWDQKLEEVSERWEERKEKESAITVSTQSQQQQVSWSQLQCKVLGCKEVGRRNCSCWIGFTSLAMGYH